MTADCPLILLHAAVVTPMAVSDAQRLAPEDVQKVALADLWDQGACHSQCFYML